MPRAERDEARLEGAIRAVRSGQLEQARQILADLLRQDRQWAEAWLWMGRAVDDPAQRRDCFQQVLRLDPDNEQARSGLVALMSGPQPQPGEAAQRPTHITAHPSACTQCGSHVRYHVATGTLRCPHCGTEQRLPEPVGSPPWLPIPPGLLSSAEAQSEPIGQDVLRCGSCGAATALSTRTASLSCPFCGSPQVTQGRGATPLIPPQAVIAFQLDEDQAQQALRGWLQRGWWRPGDLSGKAQLIELHGTYLPFWAFSGWGRVKYQLVARSKQGSLAPPLPLTRTEEQQIPVEDVLIPASYSIEEEGLRQIEPFAMEQAIPFRPAYLAGWPAEVYQVALADASIQARDEMAREVRQKASAWAPLPYDGPQGERTEYAASFWSAEVDGFRHLLLPVWLGAYRYGGRSFAFAVNGQTGKVGSQAPRSTAMLALTIACAVALLALLILLLVRFWPAIAG